MGLITALLGALSEFLKTVQVYLFIDFSRKKQFLKSVSISRKVRTKPYDISGTFGSPEASSKNCQEGQNRKDARYYE